MTTDGDVVEEIFENTPTGVEVERNDDLPGARKPWNPDSIRVSTKTYSVRHILDLIDQGDLELDSDYQRHLVWGVRQKSLLIESLLLQVPLPTFYFTEDANGILRVIDGLQRLAAIHEFVRDGSFPLAGLEYLSSVEEAYFHQLPVAMRRRISNAGIVAHVIDPTAPEDVRYDIFKRINTLGSRLTSQEIRHRLGLARSREFLRRCAETVEFDLATRGDLRRHIRMADREVVLRYCAFRLLGVDGYMQAGSMDVFLENTTSMLDDPAEISGSALEDLFASFRAAMAKSYNLFGEHAFRKWPAGVTARRPINRALFEAWSCVLSNYEVEDLRIRKDAIIEAARDLMTYDEGYIDAITIGTGSVPKVLLRFERTESAARAGL